MRRITNPHIHQAILHRVEPRAGKASADLSDLELDLDSNSEDVVDFLGDHIKKGLSDAKCISANFKGQDVDVATQASGLIDKETFVDASRFLASRLFEISSSDRRIKDGTIAFVRYSESNIQRAPVEPIYAAILKLDPSSQYTSRLKGPPGGRRVVLEIVSDVLPSIRERLQKSAFVRKHDPSDDFQALVLDRQVGDIANWFVDRFLMVEPALDDKERTERFYRNVTRFSQELHVAGRSEAAKSIVQARDQALRDASVDLEAFVDNRSELSATERGALEETIAVSLPDVEFPVDQTAAQTLLRKAVFRGDHGLRLSVREDSRYEMLDERYDDESGTWTIVITTSRWDEQ